MLLKHLENKVYLFLDSLALYSTYLVFFTSLQYFIIFFRFNSHFRFPVTLSRASSWLNYILVAIRCTHFSRVHSVRSDDSAGRLQRYIEQMQRRLYVCFYIARAMHAAKDYFIAHFRSAALVCDRYKRGILIFRSCN